MPLALATITASGGAGVLWFDLTDGQGVLQAGADGALVLTGTLAGGRAATVSVVVRDSTPVNAATVVATVIFVTPLSLTASMGEYVVSPDFTGAVHSLGAMGGFGRYSYSRVSGDAGVTVGARGAVWVRSPLAAGSRETAVFVARDEIGGEARFTLSLRVTDFSRGAGDMMFLIGGTDGVANVNDVWRSVDGVSWSAVTEAAGFAVRRNHQAVSFGGSLWVIAGFAESPRRQNFNDVWRSADGSLWELATVSAAFSARSGHQAVVFGGSLWVIGGYDGASNLGDVWRSADGVTWHLATATAFVGRNSHQAVSLGGNLWVAGGWDGRGLRNDVWRSANGVSWELVTDAAAFVGRQGHQMAALGGSLWVVGAFNASEGVGDDVWWSRDGAAWQAATVSAAFLRGRNGNQMVAFGGDLWIVGGSGNDVWRSTDGARWTRVIENAAFSEFSRVFHQVVVHRAAVPFVYEAAEIVVTAPDAAFNVSEDDALPLTVGTLAASGGIGDLRFSLLADAREVARVTEMGAVAVTSFLTGVATVSVLVRDSTPVNSATIVATVAFVTPLGVSPSAADYVVSPGYAEAVFTLSATGGFGAYSYSRVSGDAGITVNADGEVLAAGLAAEGRAMAVFEVRDEVGGAARATVRFEVAVREETEDMYLSGGTSDGNAAGEFADVWRWSATGDNWVLVTATAAFGKRQNHQMVYHGGSLWVMGGWDEEEDLLDDVWRSADGENWTSVVISGDSWGERRGHQAVSHGGNLLVIGGNHYNDVWRSADGEGWTMVAVGGRWSNRRRHQVVSHGGNLWLMGGRFKVGSSEGETNDVWRSADGEMWELVTVAAGWSARLSHQAVSHRGSLWVLGGGVKDGAANNDTWRSANGEKWFKVATSGNWWSARRSHQAVSYDGKLWVIGGRGSTGNFVDVWRSADGDMWERVTLTEGPASRHGHQVLVRRVPVPFVFERVAVAVTGPTMALGVASNDALPLRVATLTASGGGGGATV